MTASEVAIKFVAEGADEVAKQVDKVSKSVERLGNEAVESAQKVSSIDRISESMKSVGDKISGIGLKMT